MKFVGTLGVCVSLMAVGCSDSEATEAEGCDTERPGVICTIAGSNSNGYSGDEGAATSAELSLPQDTLTASNGDIYILDWNNHRIRKLTPDGIIHHVAGRGELGGSLDDPANSDFNHPTAMVFDPDEEHIFVAAWHNSKIRKLNLVDGSIEDMCGDGKRAYKGDGGPAASASFDLPTSLALDPDGTLLVMDQANQVIRRVARDGVVTRIAGNCVVDRRAPEGPGACEEGAVAAQCASDTPFANKTTCGDAKSCALPCNPGYAGDDGPAMDMRIAQPFGQSADPGGRIVFDAQGTLYFADTGNNLIRSIDSDGVVHRIAGLPPEDGTPQAGYSGDGGPANMATLHNPVDLAFGDDGTLYFSDVYNHCIRQITSDGTISTAVGQCGTSGYAGDGGSVDEALLKRPYGIEWVDGVLLIADTGNSVIRSVRLR